MKFLSGLGSFISYSIEFVAKSNTSGVANTPFDFNHGTDGTNGANRLFFLHLVFYDGRLVLDANSQNRMDIYNFNSQATTKAQYSVTRRHGGYMYLYRNNSQKGVVAANADLTALQANHAYIGRDVQARGFTGTINMFRLYKRVLSETERRLNYEYDKKTFGF